MDYFIVAITGVAGLYFHWWLYVRIKRWMDVRLAEAQAAGIKRSALPAWLEQAAAQYSGD